MILLYSARAEITSSENLLSGAVPSVFPRGLSLSPSEAMFCVRHFVLHNIYANPPSN